MCRKSFGFKNNVGLQYDQNPISGGLQYATLPTPVPYNQFDIQVYPRIKFIKGIDFTA